MKIGVLAIQGAVREHIQSLQKAGANAVPVKEAEQLAQLDGLVLPGGESTTMGKLIRQYGLVEPILRLHRERRPIFGTCAGMILLANQVADQEPHLSIMDISVQRNAVGRQIASCEVSLSVEGIADDYQAVFIRAPLILKASPEVQVLARWNGQIVAARQNHLLATSFHPELTDDDRVHRYFLQLVQETRGS